MRFFVLYFLIFASGCAHQRDAKWRSFEADAFTFSFPSDLKPTYASSHSPAYHLSAFANTEMIVSFSYGLKANTFSNWPASTAFTNVIIDGKQAVLGVAHGRFSGEWPCNRMFRNASQICFKSAVTNGLSFNGLPSIHPPPEGFPLSMSIGWRSSADNDCAKKIFDSIKFKN